MHMRWRTSSVLTNCDSSNDLLFDKEILEILDAVWAAKIHALWGISKGGYLFHLGKPNHRVDQQAKLACSRGTIKSVALTITLFPTLLTEWDSNYSQHESTWFQTEKGNYLQVGWWESEDVEIAIPEAIAQALLRKFIRRLTLARGLLRLYSADTSTSLGLPA